MNLKSLLLTCLAGTVAAAPLSAAVSVAPGVESRIAVIFAQPQNFTDVKRSYMDDTSVELLGEIQKSIRETGERAVPEGMKLEIRVTDIDLAGDFEPWHGARLNDVRILRGIYPPRIKLEFQLTDRGGHVVRSGQRSLSDLAYRTRLTWPNSDYLRYEKDLVRDWYRTEFRDVKA